MVALGTGSGIEAETRDEGTTCTGTGVVSVPALALTGSFSILNFMSTSLMTFSHLI